MPPDVGSFGGRGGKGSPGFPGFPARSCGCVRPSLCRAARQGALCGEAFPLRMRVRGRRQSAAAAIFSALQGRTWEGRTCRAGPGKERDSLTETLGKRRICRDDTVPDPERRELRAKRAARASRAICGWPLPLAARDVTAPIRPTAVRESSARRIRGPLIKIKRPSRRHPKTSAVTRRS